MKWMMTALALAFLATAAPAADDALPALKAETVAAPVKTARMFAHALSPNPRGGWNFIGQFMNYKYTTNWKFERFKTADGRPYVAFQDTKGRPPAEWVVVDLQADTFRIFDLPGFHGGAVCRAENGRIFFPVDFFQVWYYDPLTEEMKILGELREWKPFTNDRGIYRFQLGPDGYVYGTSQGYSGCCALVRINPDTLEFQVFTDVGTGKRKTKLTYGYYLGVDPPWAYVAVGQEEWELMAVNVETGEKRCLAERSGKGARITVGQGEVVGAELIGDGKKDVVWCVDGKMIPAKKNADGTLPYTPISQKKYQRVEWKNTKPIPMGAPPEIDMQRLAIAGEGAGDIYWRPAGSDPKAEWQQAHFFIKHAEAIPIESLLALPDGSILGNVTSYNGFFRCHPDADKVDYFGKHGPSRVKSVVIDGKVYFAGYPNCNLWQYDPAQPWTSNGKAGPGQAGKPVTNPWLIGYWGQTVSEAHYCNFLAADGDRRLYLAGHRERWSTGTGLGYYDFATTKKLGLGEANKDIDPAGLVVLPKLKRVVLSGTAREGVKDLKLRVYDLDLNDVEQLEVKPGLSSTGDLTPVDETRFIGLIEHGGVNALYLYDLDKKSVVLWRDLDQGVSGRIFRRPADGSLWLVLGGALCRLDPETLKTTRVATLDRGLKYKLWRGDAVYGAAGGELARVVVPGK